jgi:hypothetical protein
MAERNNPNLTNVYTTDLHGANINGNTRRTTSLFGRHIREGADQVTAKAQITESANPSTSAEKILRRILYLVIMVRLSLSTSIVAQYLEAQVSTTDKVKIWIGTRVKKVSGRLQKEFFGNKALVRYVRDMPWHALIS